MNNKSMTALISAYARSWHYRNYHERVFSDSFGEKLISKDEFLEISEQMKKGIQFFNPGFIGSDDEALKWIVNHQLSPSPLGRGAYTEKMLENAVRIGAKQYLIIASGYDTFAYRQPEFGASLEVFELDHQAVIEEKLSRLKSALKNPIENIHYIPADLRRDDWCTALLDHQAFDSSRISFCSLLGITYYLSKESFGKLLSSLASFLPKGSSIVLDYPDQDTFTEEASESTKRQVMMARAAGEPMLASYSEREMEDILSENGFLIYEHLVPEEITSQYFDRFNKAYPDDEMMALDQVNYCLAIKS